jgi:hypothetical protein
VLFYVAYRVQKREEDENPQMMRGMQSDEKLGMMPNM